MWKQYRLLNSLQDFSFTAAHYTLLAPDARKREASLEPAEDYQRPRPCLRVYLTMTRY